MCVKPILKKKNKRILFYTIAIAFGFISGFSDIPFLKDTGQLVSDIFIKMFKCISLPIIALSLIVTLSKYSIEGRMKQIWKRTLSYTLGTTIIAASVACVLYLIIRPTNTGHVASIDNKLTQSVSNSYFDYVLTLIPDNIFSPIVNHQVIGVLLVGLLIGIAIRYIKDLEAHNTIANFFKGIHEIFLVITGWIVKLIPLGLYGFISTTVTQLKDGAVELGGIGKYLSIIVLANLIQGLFILPLWLSFHKVKPFKTMKDMLPALSLAFFSKSSAGTLPVTIENAEKNIGIDPKISRFVLPLCTTINMNGCAAFIFTTVIYLMQNNGTEITGLSMIVWIVIATISAVGNAGVPMGCFFLSASLLASMDVPITLLGIILPFYGIIDMIETALNVWSDACVATIVNEKEKLTHLESKEC